MAESLINTVQGLQGAYRGQAPVFASVDGMGMDKVVPNGVHFEAMSGVDMHVMIVMPAQDPVFLRKIGLDPEKYKYPTLKTFAELQTLTISSARSVYPVRRLGEAHAHQYTRGGRTIAGTMVFTSFNRDVFAEFYRLHGTDVFNPHIPMHVDQMPEFSILIQAANEYGAIAHMGLVGVTLSNFGTTLSIHDLMVESTYTYVARYMFPFVSNVQEFNRLILSGAGRGLNVAPLSETIKIVKEGEEIRPDETGPLNPNQLSNEEWLRRFRGLGSGTGLLRGILPENL